MTSFVRFLSFVDIEREKRVVEYKTEINIYKSASTKKPASKFLDMIHALKASKKINISGGSPVRQVGKKFKSNFTKET